MRRAPGRVIAILFLCVAIASTPFLFTNLIQPRLGVLEADLTPTGMRVASVDSNTVTFKLVLRAGNTKSNPITIPLLQFDIYLGSAYLGNGWTAEEVDVPSNGQADFGAFLTMSRAPGSALFDLFQLFLDGTSANLKLQGKAFVGGVGVPFEIEMPMGGTVDNPTTGGDGDEGTDLATDFINYIQENGVDLTGMFNVVSLNATNFLMFLKKYDINLFGILYFLQEGQEWWEGLERKNMPASSGNWSVPYLERPGVQEEIEKINRNNTYNESLLAGDLYKFLWDIDEPGTFNGTTYSRVDDATYMEDFPYNSSFEEVPYVVDFTYDQARFPAIQIGPKSWVETFYVTMISYTGVSGLISLLENTYTTHAITPIQPSRTGTPPTDQYFNDSYETWIVKASDYVSDPELPNNYLRLCFLNDSALHPVLDIEGDGNVNTFAKDNLSIYDANTYNASNPEASLLARYDEDNNLIWYPASWDSGNFRHKTPWFETDALRIEFFSDGTNSRPFWGFQINGIDVWHDTKFDAVPSGNFTPWTTLDSHPYNASHRQYFNVSVQTLYNQWQADRRTGWGGLIEPAPAGPQFSSKSSSTWATLWWLQYHYDFRYLLDTVFGRNESEMWGFLFNNLMLEGELAQIQLMYGELEYKGMQLKEYPGYPTISPLHYQMDFMTGGPFSSMIQPLQKVWIYEWNDTTETVDHKLVDYFDRYGVPDALNGAGGPYAADCAYMSQLPGVPSGSRNDTSDALLNLAMTQDSRDNNSVWQMMNRIQIKQLGYLKDDTTFWNTQPLDLIKVLQLMENHGPKTGSLRTAQGEGGFSVISLLGDVDMMEFLNYAENHTDSTLGDVLRALQVSTYSMLNYIIENVIPFPADAPVPFPLAAVARNLVQGNSVIQSVFLTVPCIALGIPKRSRRCEV